MLVLVVLFVGHGDGQLSFVTVALSSGPVQAELEEVLTGFAGHRRRLGEARLELLKAERSGWEGVQVLWVAGGESLRCAGRVRATPCPALFLRRRARGFFFR